MPPPQTYPGMYYGMGMGFEHLATPRNIIAANALGILLMWIGFLLSYVNDLNVHGFARWLVMTAGFFAVLASLYGGLHAKKTSDMQNLGLFIWAGLLLFATITLAQIVLV